MENIKHRWIADELRYVLPPIKNWWHFCSEQHKDKLYIKMLGFSKEIDWYHHHQKFLFEIKRKQWKWHGCTSFLGSFYSSWRPSQIYPTADFDGAAIPHPIFSMIWNICVEVWNLGLWISKSKVFIKIYFSKSNLFFSVTLFV